METTASTGEEEKRSSAMILGSIEENFPNCAKGQNKDTTFYFLHVHKAKGDEEMEIEDPAYIVRMDRSKGVLGLKLAAHPGKRTLFVKEVLDGLAKEYNSSVAIRDQVKPGDRIVRVNDVEEDCKRMLEECKKEAALELEIHRGSAVPLTTGLTAIVKIPFGTFQEGEEGVVISVDDEGDALLKMPGMGTTQWIVKQDFHRFVFSDQDRYYLKRFSDFRDMHGQLKEKLAKQEEQSPIGDLPECPPEETWGFRRGLAAFGMSGFMRERRDGLQKMLDQLFAQVEVPEDESVLTHFFAQPVTPFEGPEVPKESVLKQRLEQLVANHYEKVLLEPLAQVR